MKYFNVRFYFRDAPPPGDLFCTIAQALAEWEQGNNKFLYFRVARDDGHARVVDKKGEFTLEELLKAARGMNDPAYELYTRASYRCWWDEDGKVEDLNTALMLFTQGTDWFRFANIDHRLEGLTRLTFIASPYDELPSDNDPHHEEINRYTEEVNRHIEENLETLSEFLMSLALTVGASSMKIFRDDVFHMPLNASFAYYRDAQALLDELRFISEIWENGLPAYEIGALKDGNAKDLERVIYENRYAEWAGRKWRDRLMDDLKTLLPIKAMPTEEDVERVLKSGRHDYYNVGDGFAVQDYPYYMNCMQDRFFVDVLKQAAGMPLERPEDVRIEE